MQGRDFRSALSVLQANVPAVTTAFNEMDAWWRCLHELLWGDQVPDENIAQNLRHGPLATPGACATASTAVVMEALTDVPRGPQKASVLSRLAQWWLTEFGDELAPEWRADCDHYRQALRAIRGIGPETADRLILVAGGLPVFPIDRGTLRIAVRHGWLDFPVDDEQTQATFHSALDGDATAMQHAARSLKSIGTRFCGRVPDCTACPLASFLPESGPLHLNEC